jgi:hypothetical protein
MLIASMLIIKTLNEDDNNHNNEKFNIYSFSSLQAVTKIESSALHNKSSTTSVASISVQPLTMTTLTATATSTAASSSSNSNLPQATTTTKKSRPKTSSPTRHGPQQCQVRRRKSENFLKCECEKEGRD